MRKQITLTIMLLLSLASISFAAQENSKKSKATPDGTPVLWKEPTDLESRDLLLGYAGDEIKPDLSRVTFIKEDTVGYSPKFRVRDGAGKIWVAKMGSEARPETASSRLLWAVGYMTEINHLVPCVQIEGAPKVNSSRVKRCANGGFADVKFEARPDNMQRLDSWAWGSNPFKGTREFQGMLVMMSMFNNWDLKDTNNKIIYVPGANGERGELRYVISDLGATFGKTGNFLSHTRNRPDTFVKTKFVEGVEGGRVRFDYNGKNSGLFNNITVEQTKWIGGLLSRLSDKQIADAFRAGNFTPEEVQLLTSAIRERINQLVNVRG